MAKIEYYSNLDLKNNEILNFVVEKVTTEPSTDASQKAGRLVSYEGSLYISDGTNFTKLGTSGALDSLESRVDGLETAVGDASSGLTQQVATNASDISSLGTRVSNTEDKITTLEGQMTAAEGDIDDLETFQTSATTDINSLKSTVGDSTAGLVKDVADNTAAIALKADANDVYDKDAIDAKVSTINTAIGTKANSADVYTKTDADTKYALYRLITDSYNKSEVDAKVAQSSTKAYTYKGSCLYAELPSSGNTEGDVWNVTDAHAGVPAGTNYAWNGTAWDALGGSVDLSGYVLTTTLDQTVQALNQTIAGKVSSDDFTTYQGQVTAALADKADADDMTTALAGKVDNSTYASDKTALETSIAGKVVKNADIPGATKCKITYDAKGLVTSGADLTASDIPDLTAAKITDFAAAVKAVRFKQDYQSVGTTQAVAHGLGIEYPHVTVYNTSTKSIIYAEVVYTDSNTVTINANAAMGSITVVVSP